MEREGREEEEKIGRMEEGREGGRESGEKGEGRRKSARGEGGRKMDRRTASLPYVNMYCSYTHVQISVHTILAYMKYTCDIHIRTVYNVYMYVQIFVKTNFREHGRKLLVNFHGYLLLRVMNLRSCNVYVYTVYAEISQVFNFVNGEGLVKNTKLNPCVNFNVCSNYSM